MGKPSRKSLKAKADRLFSEHIRSIGYCENCKRRPPDVQLQCAHWTSRRYSWTRTDERNAFCLCAGCHIQFTLMPTDFALWAIAQRGEDVYWELKGRAEQVGTAFDWEGEMERLKQL